MVDFKKIKECREEINKLIQERPELKSYQEEIDRELAKAGNNKHNRMAVLENLMMEKIIELKKQWAELGRLVK